MVVVLYPIDECQDEESVAEIISLITDAHCNSHFLIRFLIASRLKPYLQAKIYRPKIGRVTRVLALQEIDA